MNIEPEAFLDMRGDDSQTLDLFYPKKRALTPLQNLMLALLQDAISKNNPDLDWINQSNEYLFGFDCVCDHLGLDPSATRRRLTKRLQGTPTGGVKNRRYDPEEVAEAIAAADDGSFSHHYVNTMHCRECQARYCRWLRGKNGARSKPTPKYRPKRKQACLAAAI